MRNVKGKLLQKEVVKSYENGSFKKEVFEGFRRGKKKKKLLQQKLKSFLKKLGRRKLSSIK